jgi:hypothetical protein
VTVYDMDDYGASHPIEVLIAICFGGAPDAPVMAGDGTVWLRNTNCEPGPHGCYAPGSSWTGMNRLAATVYDDEGAAHTVRTFARVEVDVPLTGPATETLLTSFVHIR